MGRIRHRLDSLARRVPPATDPVGQRFPTDGQLIRMLDEHIARLSRAIEREERGEGVPAQEWERIDEEGRRLDQLCAQSDARHERNEKRWQEYIREHRPDLVARGPTVLDKEIAELEAELAELKAEEQAIFEESRESE